jgi:small ligand-binding sensory domain FIST
VPSTVPAIRFASALSTEADTTLAVDDVLEQLTAALPVPADMVIAFYSPHHNEKLGTMRHALHDELEPSTQLGVTAEGVIGTGREVQDGPGLSVIAASLPGAQLHPFRYDDIDWALLIKSPDALRASIAGPLTDVRAIIMLADPFSTPIMALLPAIHEAMPGVPVVGGMASGGSRPGANRLMFGDDWLEQGAVGLAIGGGVRVDTTVSQGCRAIGSPFVVTKSQRHLVQELGGRNALQVLQEMAQGLSDEDRQLIATTGLHVGRVIDEYKSRFGRGDFVIRGISGIDDQRGYVAIGDPQLRVGQTIQFHVRDQATARQDMELLLEMQKIHGPADGALLFSCNGRGSRLFDTPNADADMTKDAIGPAPLAGFFAAGELGPVGQQNFIHGHTACLAVFRSDTDRQASDA